MKHSLQTHHVSLHRNKNTFMKKNFIVEHNLNIQQKKTYSKNQGFTQGHTKGKATSYH